MNHFIEKLCELAGNQHRYQYTLLILTLAIWINIDIIAISLPYLEKTPDITFIDINGKMIATSMNYTLCETKGLQYKITSALTSSWVTEYNIYCNRIASGLLGSVTFFGSFVGSLLFQTIVSILGRRNAILINMLAFSLLLLVICFANSINTVLLIIFLIQLTPGTVCYASYILCCENIKADKRSMFGAIINSGFCLCGIFYILIFKYFTNWRVIFVISSFMTLICAVFVYFYVLESPRYLISNGKYKEFMKVLMDIASKNGRKQEFMQKLEEEGSEYRKCAESLEHHYRAENYKMSNVNEILTQDDLESENSMFKDERINEFEKAEIKLDKTPVREIHSSIGIGIDIGIKTIQNEQIEENKKDITHKNIHNTHELSLRKKFMMLLTNPLYRSKFLICCFLWFCINSNYYGITIHMKNLPGDIYLNGVIIYTLEIFSYLISGWLINIKSIGRKGGMRIYYSITIIGYAFLLFLNGRNEFFTLLLTFVIRFCVAGVFNILFTYTCEIYPTLLRADGFGFNASIGKIAGTMIPIFIELFMEYVDVSFAAMNLLCFFLLFFMPETVDTPLIDHI